MAMTRLAAAAIRKVTTFNPPPPQTTASFSSSSIAAAGGGGGAPVVCGRGDKRTKKGKRFKGSFGNSRPKLDKKIERIKDRVEVPRSTPWPLPFKLI